MEHGPSGLSHIIFRQLSTLSENNKITHSLFSSQHSGSLYFKMDALIWLMSAATNDECFLGPK